MSQGLVLHPSTQVAVDRYLARPAQSILITGAAGSGLSTLGQNIAASLLGISAEKLREHPYARIITPEDDKISITKIRDLQQFVSLQVPSPNPIGRAILIDDAHAMTREAQNALLKLLEEPPKQTVILLVSRHPQHLLPTIVSRVQQLRVAMPGESEVLEYIESRGYDRVRASQLLLATNQNVAETIRMLESGSEGSDKVIQLVKQALSAEPFERLIMIDRDLKEKSVARAFVNTLCTVASSSTYRVANRGDATALRRWRSILAASDAAAQLLARNGNQKIVLTELMLAL
jgi:replication-associated recombination protein RarA